MPVSYDYEYLRYSLPLVYEHADQITLAVDQEYRTWTGIQFTITDDFWNWVREIDTQKKIDIYRDNFFIPGQSAMSNGTRERNLIAERLGRGGWHVQVDSDEYFPDFGAFAEFLQRHARWTRPGAPPLDIGAFLIPIFRQTTDGFLYIKDAYETFVIATNHPDYKWARAGDNPIRYAPFCLFHQTWARSEEEIWVKANSIGHVDDYNVKSYFNLWKSIDRHNYRYIRDFHPLLPAIWHELAWYPGKDIPEFIRNYTKNQPLAVPRTLYLRRRFGQFRKDLLHRNHEFERPARAAQPPPPPSIVNPPI